MGPNRYYQLSACASAGPLAAWSGYFLDADLWIMISVEHDSEAMKGPFSLVCI
jgi:hypothetical protein